MTKKDISPVTVTVMKLLPETMRPNPSAIDEYVIAAVEKGWDVNKLAAAAMNNTKGNIGFLVNNIRNLSQFPPVSQLRKPPPHEACNDDSHDDKCVICRCVPGEHQHLVPTPMPRQLFAEYRRILGQR